jgi:hypothetical protein
MARNIVKGLLTGVIGPGLFLLGVYALVGGIVGLTGTGGEGDCKCEPPQLIGLGWEKVGLLGLGVVLVVGGLFAIRQVEHWR